MAALTSMRPFTFPRVGRRLIRFQSNIWSALVSESMSQPNAHVIGITASPSKISSDGNQRTDEFRIARSCCSTRALPDIGRARQQYLGTELRGQEGVQALHFPGLHPEAADWLVRQRQVKAVGIDTASIDFGQSSTFETHVALLSQNVPVFENLSDLRDLPLRGFDVIALPMKISGGTGGPLRVIAVLPP